MKRGFTLIELLIAMAILSVLSTIGFANFTSARIKAADAKKKSDLSTIAKSLEAYVNDHRTYPDSSGGRIVCKTAGDICNWGEAFTDDLGTIYAATLPVPSATDYVYEKTGAGFTIYTRLENTNDSSAADIPNTLCSSRPCNYKITSSNIR